MRVEKKELRKTILERRKLFPEQEREAIHEAIRTQLMDIPEILEARHIALFVSTRFEIDTLLLFEYFLGEGKKVYVPVVNMYDDMDLFEVTSLEELDLSNNNLSSVPPEIAKLVHLRDLKLFR